MLDISKTTKFKTIEEVKATAPSIFASEAISSVSKNYIHIPTSQTIEDMAKLGWNVVDAKEVKSKKYKGYQKHLLVFRNLDVVINGEDGDTVFPQILISNSHDGKSAFVFRASIFRLVCENGLVIADKEFGKLSIRHVGYKFEELQKTINTMVEKLPLTVESMNRLKQIKLTEKQIMDFTKQALSIRLGPDNINRITIDYNEFLKPTRKEDEGNGLWEVFNRTQEKIIDGDFTCRYSNKTRKARKIKNFQQDIKVNERLWELAMSYFPN